ncbi:sensor histidine kinase [Novosphingobium sp. PC22D]|uniref:sensor histidine kinase n=1 Tax=Novosphingobium sp. PC22D TaxID=1962403 RepID=UPI000BEF8171|nr:ATP-binding protein [Novosphingobium sp. PC22D]PEQ13291.1 sensor histidine kinase [Novosphingobium sp. PC22D]
MASRGGDSRLNRWGWSWRVSLTARILAVNVIALALLAGSLFYIDSYRKELLAERFRLAASEVEITSHALEERSRKQRRALMMQIGSGLQLRLRLYDEDGELEEDSFDLVEPSYVFVDPASESTLQKAARLLDRGMDFLIGAPPIPAYADPDGPSANNWPELAEALETGTSAIGLRLAPDRTPVIIAAAPVGEDGESLLITRNARDITQNVRDARQTLAIIVGAALVISILLSLFLARTIVEPLRKLVRAAVRVRLGRDREVVVPRLPERGDEIGLLARAISDMTAALRERIDAVESFAADVAHELKNPLTSLRSAVETLGRVEDPALRRQLLDIAAQDVRRIDFLVTEIADASRIDAELSRARFEPVDMLRLIMALVAERDQRGVNGTCKLVVGREGGADMTVAGSPPRLERVFHNLIDNAVSFSPPGASILIALSREGDRVLVSVSDEGPGIPADAREKIFERFHSLRPASEEFGTHSGLGLAIARTIVEAHFGRLTAGARADGREGARLIVSLPAWEGEI